MANHFLGGVAAYSARQFTKRTPRKGQEGERKIQRARKPLHAYRNHRRSLENGRIRRRGIGQADIRTTGEQKLKLDALNTQIYFRRRICVNRSQQN